MKASRFAVEIEGRTLTAEVAGAAESPTLVTVEGEVFEVSCAPDGALLVRARASGWQQVVTPDGQPRPERVAIGGHDVEVSVQTVQEAARAAARAAAAGGRGGTQVKAPMPGRVVKVLVGEGEAVEEGAPVVIVEAMKMENEMYAPCTGVVKAVAVREGDTVDGGQLLCVFEARGPGEAS